VLNMEKLGILESRKQPLRLSYVFALGEPPGDASPLPDETSNALLDLGLRTIELSLQLIRVFHLAHRWMGLALNREARSLFLRGTASFANKRSPAQVVGPRGGPQGCAPIGGAAIGALQSPNSPALSLFLRSATKGRPETSPRAPHHQLLTPRAR
jgi:hypothetical protein